VGAARLRGTQEERIAQAIQRQESMPIISEPKSKHIPWEVEAYFAYRNIFKNNIVKIHKKETCVP
jgi:hypothetical protein